MEEGTEGRRRETGRQRQRQRRKRRDCGRHLTRMPLGGSFPCEAPYIHPRGGATGSEPSSSFFFSVAPEKREEKR